MDKEEKLEFHKCLLEGMHDLYKRKNSDYGDSVHETYKRYGMPAYLVRIEDKLNRVRGIIQSGKQLVEDEKIQDTLMDAANYCILALISLESDRQEKENGYLATRIHENSIDTGYLNDWYINSHENNDDPIWTEKHLEELNKDFYLIPKEGN